MCGVLDIVKHFFSDTVERIEKPEARVTDVDLKGIGDHAIIYLAKVLVSNPYCIPIPLGEIRYALKSAGSVIASGTIFDTGSLKGNGDTTLYVEIDVSFGVLVNLVKDIAVDWDIDYELDVKLIIDLPIVCDITLPVNKSGEVKLPSFADMFNKEKEDKKHKKDKDDEKNRKDKDGKKDK